jgi:disulfide bond formation protein DsbB
MMRKSTLLLILMAFLALLLVACGGGDDGGSTSDTAEEPAEETAAMPEGDVVAGEAKFQATCSPCHGADAKGLPNLGKDMTVSEFIIGSSDAELLAFIKVGRPPGDAANTTGVDMPPKGGNPALSDEDLANIIAFMRTLEQ